MKVFGLPNHIKHIPAIIALVALPSVLEQGRADVSQILKQPPTTLITNKQSMPFLDPFYEEEKIDKDSYDKLFEDLHCSSMSKAQFFDSLLIKTDAPKLLTSFERQSSYDSLCTQFPKAKKYKQLIETSSFLEQGLHEYMKVKTDIDTLLAHHAPHLGSYDRYLSLSRKITKYAKTKHEKNEHFYLSESYIQRLSQNIGGEIINKDINSILFPKKKSTQSKQKTVFPNMVQTAPRTDTINIGSKRLITEHFPTDQARDSLHKYGRNTFSSKYGPDDGTSFAYNRTCTHGIQPIVRQGLHLLEEKLFQLYQVNINIKIIRGGTEERHFFGENNTGVVAGQLSPSYNKKIRKAKKTSLEKGTLKELWRLFTTHGFGNTVDISNVGSNRTWAMEDLLNKGQPIGPKYNLMYLGDNVYMIYLIHKEDISRHPHCSFITGEQLKRLGLGTYIKK